VLEGLHARTSHATLLAACERRAGDGGARAAAASPSVRPGEINKTLKLHAGGF